jgi:beta-glucosidase
MLETTGQYADEAQQRVVAMNLKEKVGLMTGRGLTKLILPIHFLVFKQYNRAPYPNNPVLRLDVPSIKFCDGPRGVVSQNSTCFPVAMARGATFDVALERRVGEVIGKEVIAAGGNYFAGVCINLLRHPAWGRAQEVYGEDPHLLGQMGVAVTQSVQALGVMACLKHFAMNSMENARFKVDVNCSERTLREVYLPHFKDCVDAGAASVMTAYNQVQGEYCGQNKKLIRTILKDEWGFSGFVITDFIWGIYDTVTAAESGMDIEMPWPTHYGKKLVKAVNNGRVDEKHIDEAATRITGTTLRFNEILKKNNFDQSVVACEEHRQLARLIAEKSMTLLKNDNSLLPLKRETVKRIAVLGKLASVESIGDHGSSKVVPPYVITPLQGLENLLGSDVIIDYCNGDDIAAAVQASENADAVLFVVGNRHSDEGEYLTNNKRSPGGDRDRLSLRPEDVALIKAAAAVNPNTVTILIGGSAITLSEWDAQVSSILYAYYPGMEGGNALARTLFGESVPGGKLPFTIPTDAAHLPYFDKNTDAIEYGYYHGYTLMDKESITPAYAFGYGMSYSQFELSDAEFSTVDNYFVAAVTVKNTGSVTADEVVQLYIGCRESSIDRAVKILRGFDRVTLQPGEARQIVLRAHFDTLRWYDEESSSWRFEELTYELYIGSSSRDQDLISGHVDLSPKEGFA